MGARQQRRQRAGEDAEVSSNADLEAPSTMQFDAVTTATPLGGVAVPEFTARTDVTAERRSRAEVFGGNLL
jgi:hypothetical protein